MFLQQIGQDILKKDESNEKHENTEEIKKSQVIKKSKKKHIEEKFEHKEEDVIKVKNIQNQELVLEEVEDWEALL